MFNPQDNFPDEFDTSAYRRYQPHFRRGVWLWLRERALGGLWVGIISLAIGGGCLGAWFLFPPQPTIIVVTAQPSSTPLGDILGDFPPDIRQESITLPAKIDHRLGAGEQHGYRFFASSDLSWTIRVLPDANFDPVLTLYNPDGSVAQINNDRATGERTSELTFQAQTTAQYGITITSNGATAGGYTLQILPIPPQ